MSNVVDVVLKLTDMVSGKLRLIRDNMAKTSKINKRLSHEVKAVGRNISGIGSALAPVSAGIVAAGTASVKAFIGFDATITAAGAKAGATTAELKELRDTAAKLGAKFPVSASAVAVAMDNLAASGFNAKETIATMPAILTAAVASGEDLATTSSVVTSALNVWNLKQGDVGKNAARMADVIQQAANMSSLTMTDFGVAMQYAGAPAAALKVNVEELATALAVIKNKGIDASTAGTSLRAMFTRLSKPPKEAADAISQLGIKVKDAKGNFVGLEKVISQLRTAMAGMSNTQRIAFAQAIAGTEGYSSLLALIDESAAGYKKMSDAMNNANGSSAKQFAIMSDTLKGSIDSMLGSLESLAINTGDILAPKMKIAAQVISDVAKMLNKLSPEQKEMIANIGIGIVSFTAFMFVAGKVVAVIGGLIGLYSQISAVLAGCTIANKLLQYSVLGIVKALVFLKSTMTTLIPKIGSMITALMSPMGLVIVAIAVLAYLIYRNWDSVKKFLIRTFSAISNGLKIAFDFMKNIAAICFGGFIANLRILRDTIYGILDGIIGFITAVFAGDWSSAWNSILGIFQTIVSGISGIFSNTLNSIRSMINFIIDKINGIQVDVPSWVPVVGGNKFGPLNIPKLYTGTNNWSGGPAMIHDKGAEIVDLPTGSRVIPHDKSLQMSYRAGQENSTVNLGGVSVNISGVTINGNSDIENLAKQITDQICSELHKRAVNLKVGAI